MRLLKQLFITLCVSCVSGCRSVQYSDPNGRKVSVVVIGIDTKIGSFTAASPDGLAIQFTNLDTAVDPGSVQAMVSILSAAISKIPGSSTTTTIGTTTTSATTPSNTVISSPTTKP